MIESYHRTSTASRGLGNRSRLRNPGQQRRVGADAALTHGRVLGVDAQIWYTLLMGCRPKPCERCGETFQPIGNRAKWCDACRQRVCDGCGSAFRVDPGSHRAERYCSNACYLAHRWRDVQLEERTCPVCSSPFTVSSTDRRKVCSWDCRNKLRSITQQGERSHFWRGGKTAPYHQEWKAIRREALDRDGHRCVRCGGTDRLQVHHVIPYRYSRSHALTNLTTLCRSCHSKVEFAVNPAHRGALADGRELRLRKVGRRRSLDAPKAQHTEG